MKTRSHTANTSRSLPSRVMAVLLSAVLFCTGLSLGSFASAEELPVLETDVSQGSSGNLSGCIFQRHVHTIGCVWGFRGEQELERAGADDLARTPADLLRFMEI